METEVDNNQFCYFHLTTHMIAVSKNNFMIIWLYMEKKAIKAMRQYWHSGKPEGSIDI